MKYILYLIIFICATFAFIFAGDYIYDQAHTVNIETIKSENGTKDKIGNAKDINKNIVKNKTNNDTNHKDQSANLTSEKHTNTNTKTSPSTENAQDINQQTNTLKTVPTNTIQIVEKTPPHFSAGFDWSLPENTQITNNSGLIAEENHDPKVVKNRFIIVRWDNSNLSQGKYDFSKLDANLKSIAPQQALIRLEVNSSCEAPKWALSKLRETKAKSLIYWDKNYQDLTRPFIQAFAKRFAANPQIIGVQLGLADGEFGEAADSCNDYDNKNGWGEFWMSPDERKEAETRFGFSPSVFTQATMDNIDIYTEAFGKHKNKLAFTNIGTLFTYGEGSEAYNQQLKTIAKYALDNGIGNRDGAVERWMSYTDKIYGSVFTTMSDGSCRLDMNEDYIRKVKDRYWGTENEFYGDKDYVTEVMGPVENHPYIFMISSLRALQMRRNAFSLSDMRQLDHVDYKTQDFLKYLTLTLGKQYEDTPDAFVLMGERYIAPYRLTDQMDVECVRNNSNYVPVRSFGRWLIESPVNTEVDNKPSIKVRMPKSENNWYQGYYLPEGIDYEYFAREANQFSFDLNDELSQSRCKDGCNVEIKATFKDTVKTKLHAQVLEGVSAQIETLGDNKIKTVTFQSKSKFAKQMQGLFKHSDLILHSENHAIPLILMRINFLD